jgi:hypothetical protein
MGAILVGRANRSRESCLTKPSCSTDDLLECDCLTRDQRVIEEPEPEPKPLPTAEDIMNEHREKDDSEEEDAEEEKGPRFVAASQYDPAGVSNRTTEYRYVNANSV